MTVPSERVARESLARFHVGQHAHVLVQLAETAPAVGEIVIVAGVLDYAALRHLEEHYDPEAATWRSSARGGIVLAHTPGRDRLWHYGPDKLAPDHPDVLSVELHPVPESPGDEDASVVRIRPGTPAPVVPGRTYIPIVTVRRS